MILTYQYLPIIIKQPNNTMISFNLYLFSAILMYQAGATGITAGAHRLWAHRAYKAKTPLKLILLLFNTLAFQVRSDRSGVKIIISSSFSYSLSDLTIDAKTSRLFNEWVYG
jgi:Fatty-acid desaturase